MTKQQGYETPRHINEQILAALGIDRFTLDPCTTDKNPVNAEHYYTKEQNGLKKTWNVKQGATYIHLNPPYNQLLYWIRSAIYYSEKTHIHIAAILPNRGGPFFMEIVDQCSPIILQRLDQWTTLENGQAGIYYLRKRIKFIDPTTGQPAKNPDTNSMIIIWK